MIFGWDISTSIIGATVLTDSGQFVESLFCDLRKVEHDMNLKAYQAELFVERFAVLYAKEGCHSQHYVEDRLSNFAAGRTMLQTLMKLAAFNAVVTYVIWQKGSLYDGTTSIEHLHPSTVKSVMRKQGLVIPKGGDKKQLTLDWVSKAESGFPLALNKNDNPQPYCYDMADSYIVAKAGYLLGCAKTAK